MGSDDYKLSSVTTVGKMTVVGYAHEQERVFFVDQNNGILDASDSKYTFDSGGGLSKKEKVSSTDVEKYGTNFNEVVKKYGDAKKKIKSFLQGKKIDGGMCDCLTESYGMAREVRFSPALTISTKVPNSRKEYTCETVENANKNNKNKESQPLNPTSCRKASGSIEFPNTMGVQILLFLTTDPRTGPDPFLSLQKIKIPNDKAYIDVQWFDYPPDASPGGANSVSVYNIDIDKK